MIETYLRPLYQSKFADHLARRMKQFQPFQITYLSCVTGIIAAMMIPLHFPLVATISLLSSGFLDTLDGTIARMNFQSSTLGCVMDILSDRIVEFMVIVGLFLVDTQNRSGASLFMLGSCYLCITSFLVVGIFTPHKYSDAASHHMKKQFHYSPGLIERAEAFLFFLLMIWFPNYFSFIAYLFSALVLFTTYVRIKQFSEFRQSYEAKNSVY